MPSWMQLRNEAKSTGGAFDVVRRKYLAKLSKLTGRNAIVYYSGWLQKGDLAQGTSWFSVNDADKNGFMATIYKLDRSKGLDLILHTPGGSTAATESLVDYLRAMFGNDMRAIVPQLAMSAGTMIALACKEIIMGKHSSLGPIDPQIGGLAAHGVIEEFGRAATEMTGNPSVVPLWQPIIAKYQPTLIGECQKAITWGNEMVRQWLVTGMFEADPDRDAKAARIVSELSDHALTLSHARHISLKQAKDLNIRITQLEDDDRLQDAVLSVHHACIQTLSETPALKIIENQQGVAYIPSIGAIQARA